jgi:hypothetical protein
MEPQMKEALHPLIRHSREGGNPVTLRLQSRLRVYGAADPASRWIPAFAGMTSKNSQVT